MITHPTAGELIEAVRLFLERVGPTLQGRDVFLARVAANALAAASREIETGGDAEARAEARLAGLVRAEGGFSEMNQALCRAIQDGLHDEPSDALRRHLGESARDQVRIDQPGYSGLQAYEAALSRPDGSPHARPR